MMISRRTSRPNMMKLSLMTAVLALGLGACGDDGNPPGVDAPLQPDAMPVVPEWSSLTGAGNLNAAFYMYNGEYYAVVGDPAGPKTVCKWSDANQAWEPQTAPNDNLQTAFIVDAQGILAKVGGSICRWNEATQVWDPVAPAPAGSTMLAAFEYNADNDIKAIIDGMVQSWDGTAWTANTGVGTLNAAFRYVNGEYYAVVGPADGDKTVCKWSDANQAWEPQTTPNPALETAFIIDANGAIVAKVGGSICRWNPDTQTWDGIAPAPAGTTMLAAFTYTSDQDIMAIIDQAIMKWGVPAI